MSDDIHFYEPKLGHGLKHDPFNAIIGPRPIGWLSTIDREGRVNLAPYSFFNAFNYTPPILGFSSTGRKDTVNNIEATGEFVWNLVTRAQAEAMNQTSAPAAPGVDEFVLAGLAKLPSRLVKPPRVAGSPVTMECRLIEIIRLKGADGTPVDSWLTLGEVVAVHIERRLVEGGVYHTDQSRTVLRAGGAGDFIEVEAEAFFQMFRPTTA